MSRPTGRASASSDGVLTGVDDGLVAMLRRPRQDLLGLHWTELLTRGARLFWLARRAQGARPGDLSAVELDLAGPDGEPVPVTVSIHLRTDGGYEIAVRDRSDHPVVGPPEPRTDVGAVAVRAAGFPIVVVDLRNTVLEWNLAAERILGFRRADVLGTDLAALLGGGSTARTLSLAELLAAPSDDRTEVAVVRADGRVLVVEAAVTETRVEAEAIRVVQLRDLARLASARPASTGTGAAERPVAMTGNEDGIPTADVVVLGIDADGRYDVVEGSSTRLQEMFGPLLGRSYREVLEARPTSLAAVEAATAGQVTALESRLYDQDWYVVCRPRTTAAGAPAGVTMVATETTALRALQAEAVRRSTTDPLTGLLNRAGLHEALVAEVGSHRTTGTHVSLIELDLDDFTSLNEALGQDVGDQVLVEVARRLAATAPTGAVLARHGADEFAVLLGAQVVDQPDLAAHRIGRALSAPMTFDGEPFEVSATLGLARWPDDARDGNELLSHADAAVRRARTSRTALASYDEQRDDPRGRFRLVARLRRALATGGIEVHVQPVVDLVTGQMNGVEALVRWTDEELGVVSAADLVAAAEEARLIDDVGAIVIDRTCEILAQWDASGRHVARAAVNVSPLQLRSGRLAPALESAVRRHGLTWDRLTVELTESAVAGLDDQGLRVLERLRQSGVHVALDDFGTGHSSLARLRDLPVDVVKLDRSFVTGLPDAVPAALITAFVGVADALGLATVAEGVETEAQRQALADIGCEWGQGYLFSRPVPADVLG